MLLAVDSSQRIAAANRAARTAFSLDDQGLRTGVGLWAIFERDAELFRGKEGIDVVRRLVIVGGAESHSVLVTPPAQPSPPGVTRQPSHCTRARASM